MFFLLLDLLGKFVDFFLAGDEATKEMNPRVSHFLSCMKIMCQQKRPEVSHKQ